MHIAIMGAGSMGLLLAAKLSGVVSGRIEVITRTEAQAESITHAGITLSGGAAISADKFKVLSYENRLASSKGDFALDYLLLTVKQSAIDEELLSFLVQHISPHTTLVCFQNGMGHLDKLLPYLNERRILLAITTEGARKLGHAQVAHTGQGVTDIGYSCYLREEKYPQAQKKFASLLESAGFEVSLSKDMGTKVWSKLIINSIINPLTAVLQLRNGELLRSSSTVALMSALYKEGIAVAEAMQVVLPDNLWETILQVCERTADNQSSMLQDIIHQRSTEIDSINGSLLRLAENIKLELPVNQIIVHMVRVLENK